MSSAWGGFIESAGHDSAGRHWASKNKTTAEAGDRTYLSVVESGSREWEARYGTWEGGCSRRLRAADRRSVCFFAC